MAQSARLAKTLRRERPIVAAGFGARLRLLRGLLSRGAICERLLALGVSLDRSTLLQYERGTVGSPDPVVLWGLSRLYRVTLDDLVADLVRDRTGRAAPRREVFIELDGDQRGAAALLGKLSGEELSAVNRYLEFLTAPLPIERPASPSPKKFKGRPR
jgi:transcriptional regulator with XRE-family HTH domain